uniref:SANT domain-containing protein n=1 Tax=Davidia involucrata TaxID=16924 RepID=A0A5B6ZU57_DAVIN
MAPTRKSRSVNKRFSNYNEVSPDKDVGNSNKSRQRKRKLSDMLGSQWSKDELQCFYEAYRNYGKDWKKVAGVVRNRSVEMVEALYNMNRAYLSLPEGTASVAGLIAMMTDHYNVLEGSDSDRESNDASRLSRNPQKRGRGKVQLSASKDHLQSQSVASNDGCLSLLKRRRSDGCAVGKRTPRFPVSYSFRKVDSENYVSSNKRGRKSEVDDEVAHGAALALAEALQRGGSPQVSHSPFKTERMKLSPLHSCERMRSQSEIARAKLPGTAMDEYCLEGSLGSRGAENGDYARDITSALMGIEGVGTVEVYQKGKKFYRKKEKVEDIRINQFDDGREACSGTEEGLDVSDVKGKIDIEVTNVKIERSSSQGKRKRNKKLFFGDESSALDALQTLADLSLMMPASTIESESSVQLNEQKPTLDPADRSSVPEDISISHQGDKTKILGVREKVLHASSGVEASTSRKCKLGRDSAFDVNALSGGEQPPQSSNKGWKRKQKSSTLKAFAEVEEKPVIKGKRTGQIFAPSKQGKSIRPAECSSNSDQKRAGTDSAASTAQVPTTSLVNLPTKQRSRRKMDPKRILIQKEMKSGEIISKDQPNKYSTSLQDREKLSCYLLSYLVRRWCTFEWFYSAIDYPWFTKREFVEYLNHVGLGHVPRLTRVEWGVIRSSLGKPRRFSEHFLGEEKEKLKQYRESVRKHYTELRAGIREGLPTDLARPLSVGQRVIALHPKTREVHDGSVLTVDHDKCRIQFDRPELGVEFVMDIDCMPLNPLENMPEVLRRQNIAVDKFSVNSRVQKAGQSNIGGSMVFAPSEHLENGCGPIHTLITQGKDDTASAISQAKAAMIDIVNVQQAAYGQHCTVAHVHAREADIWALSDLTHALDKKEAILMELKHAKDDVLKTQNGGNSSLKDSELLKKQYTTVSSTLLTLRQHNTYPGNSLAPWLNPPAISGGLGGPPSSIDHSSVNYQESGSNVVETVKGSRFKAHTMVDAAIQAMSSMKEGEDAFMRIGEALDSLNKRKFSPDFGASVMRSIEQVNGVAYQHQLSSFTLEPPPIGHVSGPMLHNNSDRIEAQIPSELITSCVATLLMVQMCTERQYPPADVAQILDSAVTSLHPCCPQNLPIYREIQMCMGRIKTQILALVPT